MTGVYPARIRSQAARGPLCAAVGNAEGKDISKVIRIAARRDRIVLLLWGREYTNDCCA
jgi:hypothetical protein